MVQSLQRPRARDQLPFELAAHSRSGSRQTSAAHHRAEHARKVRLCPPLLAQKSDVHLRALLSAALLPHNARFFRAALFISICSVNGCNFAPCDTRAAFLRCFLAALFLLLLAPLAAFPPWGLLAWLQPHRGAATRGRSYQLRPPREEAGSCVRGATAPTQLRREAPLLSIMYMRTDVKRGSLHQPEERHAT